MERDNKGQFIKGGNPWNKGLSGTCKHTEEFKEARRAFRHSEETKIRISTALKGRRVSIETRRKMSEIGKGRVVSDETKEKLRLANLGKRPSVETRLKRSKALKGDKCYLWRGGITKDNLARRNSIEIRLWREAVFARDNWTCQNCGDKRGGNLQAHHIKHFSEYPELATSIENGITLCRRCHAKEHPAMKCIDILNY